MSKEKNYCFSVGYGLIYNNFSILFAVVSSIIDNNVEDIPDMLQVICNNDINLNYDAVLQRTKKFIAEFKPYFVQYSEYLKNKDMVLVEASDAGDTIYLKFIVDDPDNYFEGG